ncbi:MAG: flagellar motor protein [Chthonomonadaceae bacterium]|nr:flagellar motor protein [Chthonomonadaceae bacterium]
MNISTLFGMILAWGALIGSLLMEGGDVRSLVNLPAAFLVFGGTFGACLISCKTEQITGIPGVLSRAFQHKSGNPVELISTLVRFADRARKEGLLALETEMKRSEDEFLKRAMRLAIDGTDPETLREILATDIHFCLQRHRASESVFTTLGGFAPTLGIIGTVMGLVHMLSNLSDPGKMGPLIAGAFIATLYGVSSANLLFIPIANKLKQLSHEETLLQEIIVEGAISIQAGDNPRLVEERLKAFIAPEFRDDVRGISVIDFPARKVA